MKKLQDKLPLITLGLLVCTFLVTCSANRTIGKLEKQNKEFSTNVTSLETLVDSLYTLTIPSDELQTRLELEGYKISARNLYYNNAIVRTKVRPDDVMHDYNQKIDELTKKLK
jgi:hypothetical protein